MYRWATEWRSEVRCANDRRNRCLNEQVSVGGRKGERHTVAKQPAVSAHNAVVVDTRLCDRQDVSRAVLRTAKLS